MPTKLDLAGQTFGRWLVIEANGVRRERTCSRSLWRCRCTCGVVKADVLGFQLTNGTSRSCGCLQRESAVFVGQAKRTHQGSLKHPHEWNSWRGMLSRCRNPNNDDWHLYGGRGIAVCERWYSFEAFLADMGKQPNDGVRYTIERVDNDGPYEPSNCVWATYKTQANNRRPRLSNVHG